jgi:hypothetical protein
MRTAGMTMISGRFRIFTAVQIAFLAVSCFAQEKLAPSRLKVVEGRPLLYLELLRIGAGERFYPEEPDTRIWFHIVNNSKFPVQVTTLGRTEKSPDEVRLVHEVVRDSPTQFIVAEDPLSSAPHEKPKQLPLPRAYAADLVSSEVIQPDHFLLFSIPVDHVGKDRRIEIPYEFVEDKVTDKVRPENIGGYPRMVLVYGVWDLPTKYQNQVLGK